MNVFDVIFEEPETLGTPQEIQSGQDLADAFSEAEWMNIIEYKAKNFIKNYTKGRYKKLQDLSEILGKGAGQFRNTGQWLMRAQQYGMSHPSRDANWQDIHDWLKPAAAIKSKTKPDAKEPANDQKISQYDTLNKIKQWVTVPEKEELTKEEAQKYWISLTKAFFQNTSPGFKKFFDRVPEGRKISIFEELYNKATDKVKSIVKSEGKISTTQVQNIFYAFAEPTLNQYNTIDGGNPFDVPPETKQTDDPGANPGGS